MKNRPGEVLLFLASASLAPVVLGLLSGSFMVFIDGLACVFWGAFVIHFMQGNRPQG